MALLLDEEKTLTHAVRYLAARPYDYDAQKKAWLGRVQKKESAPAYEDHEEEISVIQARLPKHFEPLFVPGEQERLHREREKRRRGEEAVPRGVWILYNIFSSRIWEWLYFLILFGWSVLMPLSMSSVGQDSDSGNLAQNLLVCMTLLPLIPLGGLVLLKGCFASNAKVCMQKREEMVGFFFALGSIALPLPGIDVVPQLKAAWRKVSCPRLSLTRAAKIEPVMIDDDDEGREDTVEGSEDDMGDMGESQLDAEGQDSSAAVEAQGDVGGGDDGAGNDTHSVEGREGEREGELSPADAAAAEPDPRSPGGEDTLSKEEGARDLEVGLSNAQKDGEDPVAGERELSGEPSEQDDTEKEGGKAGTGEEGRQEDAAAAVDLECGPGAEEGKLSEKAGEGNDSDRSAGLPVVEREAALKVRAQQEPKKGGGSRVLLVEPKPEGNALGSTQGNGAAAEKAQAKMPVMLGQFSQATTSRISSRNKWNCIICGTENFIPLEWNGKEGRQIRTVFKRKELDEEQLYAQFVQQPKAPGCSKCGTLCTYKPRKGLARKMELDGGTGGGGADMGGEGGEGSDAEGGDGGTAKVFRGFARDANPNADTETTDSDCSDYGLKMESAYFDDEAGGLEEAGAASAKAQQHPKGAKMALEAAPAAEGEGEGDGLPQEREVFLTSFDEEIELEAVEPAVPDETTGKVSPKDRLRVAACYVMVYSRFAFRKSRKRYRHEARRFSSVHRKVKSFLGLSFVSDPSKRIEYNFKFRRDVHTTFAPSVPRRVLEGRERYEAGDRIESWANRVAYSWYPGTVTLARGNLTYDVAYQNGEEARHVFGHQMRFVQDRTARPLATLLYTIVLALAVLWPWLGSRFMAENAAAELLVLPYLLASAAFIAGITVHFAGIFWKGRAKLGLGGFCLIFRFGVLFSIPWFILLVSAGLVLQKLGSAQPELESSWLLVLMLPQAAFSLVAWAQLWTIKPIYADVWRRGSAPWLLFLSLLSLRLDGIDGKRPWADHISWLVVFAPLCIGLLCFIPVLAHMQYAWDVRSDPQVIHPIKALSGAYPIRRTGRRLLRRVKRRVRRWRREREERAKEREERAAQEVRDGSDSQQRAEQSQEGALPEGAL